MSSPVLSYQQFLQTVEGSESTECMTRMAYVSQMRRRGSNVSIYSQHSFASSACSQTSAKSAVPCALDLDSALYQKGFDLRQHDSDEEFDTILELGFNGTGFEAKPTLKLTLSPPLVRN